MSELLIALAGVVAGALATGGVQTYTGWQVRRNHTRVAARLLTGELYLAEHSLKEIADRAQWPDKAEPNFDHLFAVWDKHREAFAAGVSSTDWNDVAIACRSLVDMPHARTPGSALDADDVRKLRKAITNLDRASLSTLKHSATRRERNSYIKTVEARRAEVRAAES